MAKVTLNMGEVSALNKELGELLRSKIEVTIKFWLHDLKKKIADDAKTTDTMQVELMREYGDVRDNVDGSVSARFPDKEKYKVFTEELEKVLAQEKEYEYKRFKLSSFKGIEALTDLEVFFKLATNDLPIDDDE